MSRPASNRAAQQRRRQRLDELKLSLGGCVDCGYNEHPAALHFDHIGPKEHNYRQAFRPSWAWARILAEIEKCELVCANCHAVRTAKRGYTGGRPMHGRPPKRPVVRGEFGVDLSQVDYSERRRRPKPPLATHCSAGHEYTPENTYITPSTGQRSCRKCRARYARDARARGSA